MDSVVRSEATHTRCRDDVRIPCASGYLDVVDTVLLLGCLPKDMSVHISSDPAKING